MTDLQQQLDEAMAMLSAATPKGAIEPSIIFYDGGWLAKLWDKRVTSVYGDQCQSPLDAARSAIAKFGYREPEIPQPAARKLLEAAKVFADRATSITTRDINALATAIAECEGGAS